MAGITCLGLAVIGALVAAEHYANLADELNIKSIALESRIVETETQRLSALNGMDEARAWAEAANARVAELQARLDKKVYPPKPRPAPATSKELETVIVRFGFAEGLSVFGLNSALSAWQTGCPEGV